MTLADLRTELDSIDTALHDLVMRRAAVVQRVAACKATEGVPASLRPGREAAILRRLLARHEGDLPPHAILRIWRELLAGAVGLQTPFGVAAPTELAALAREQFGALTPMHRTATPAEALAAVRTGQATIAILPLAGAAWWPLLIAAEPPLHIVARLPFWRPRPPGAPAGEALVVAAFPPDPSGDDHTLLAVPESDSHHLATAALAPIQTIPFTVDGAPWWLALIDGFITAADPRLAALPPPARVLGAYASPIG